MRNIYIYILIYYIYIYIYLSIIVHREHCSSDTTFEIEREQEKPRNINMEGGEICSKKRGFCVAITP